MPARVEWIMPMEAMEWFGVARTVAAGQGDDARHAG
jgi:hypothetical protein